MRLRSSLLLTAALGIACSTGGKTDSNEPAVSSGGSTGTGGGSSTGGSTASGGGAGSDSTTGGKPGTGGDATGGLGGATGGKGMGGEASGGMGGEGTGGTTLSAQDEVCSSDGWCWAAPLAHGHSIYAFAESDSDFWGVGEGGVIVREHEGGFTTMHYPGLRDFNDVAMVGDAVWIAGEDGLLLQWNDGKFSEIPIPTAFDLRAIVAFSASDVWIGGEAALFHFDGDSFEDHSDHVSSVHSIGGVSSDDLYVGGTGPTGVLSHYDGKEWSFESGLHLLVSGYRTFTSIQNYDGAVYVSSNYTDGILWKKEGGKWGKVLLGHTYPVWELDSDGDTLWIAGEHGVFSLVDDMATLEFSLPAFERTRSAVHAGSQGVTAGIAGGRLRRSTGGDFAIIYGTEWSGIGEDGVFSVSPEGDVTWLRNTTSELKDGVWSETPLPHPNESIGLFRGAEGVFALNGKDVLLRSGATWDLQFTGVDQFYKGWQAPNGEMFLVGRIRTAHYDGDSWEELMTVVGGYNVHGSSADNVWTVGSTEIHHFDGENWTYMFDHDVMGTDWLTAVFVLAPDSVWVGGSDGVLYHFDGEDWSPYPTGTGHWIFDIVGLAEDDIWAVGGPHVYHFDGNEWTVEEIPCARYLNGLDIQDENTVWAGGPGTLLRWQRP